MFDCLEKVAFHFSGSSRQKKYSQFVRLMRPTPNSTIIDVGVVTPEYSPVDNLLEKIYPHPEKITAITLDDPKELRQLYPAVSFNQADGRMLPYSNDAFDIGYSNAVIEHVGTLLDMRRFLSELVRVSRRGYLTTPNKFFPIEPHTRVPILHLLPKRYFDRFLCLIGKGWAAGNYMRLLSGRELEEIARQSGLAEFKIHRNRLLFFTLTFTLVWEKAPGEVV